VQKTGRHVLDQKKPKKKVRDFLRALGKHREPLRGAPSAPWSLVGAH
jgi:hypothetical protein